jgi:hypothetical protein
MSEKVVEVTVVVNKSFLNSSAWRYHSFAVYFGVLKRHGSVAARPNQQGNMDFISDSIAIGRWFRAFTVVHDYSRECPAIEVNTCLGGIMEASVLDGLTEASGLLGIIKGRQWT